MSHRNFYDQYRGEVHQRTADLLTGQRPRNPRLSGMSTKRLMFEAIVEELRIYKLRKQEQVQKEHAREWRRMERHRERLQNQEQRRSGQEYRGRLRRREGSRDRSEHGRSDSHHGCRRKRRVRDVQDPVVEGFPDSNPYYMMSGGTGPPGNLSRELKVRSHQDTLAETDAESTGTCELRRQNVGPDGHTKFGQLPKRAAGVGFLQHFKKTYQHIKAEHMAGHRDRSTVEKKIDIWRGKGDAKCEAEKVDLPYRGRERPRTREMIVTRRGTEILSQVKDLQADPQPQDPAKIEDQREENFDGFTGSLGRLSAPNAFERKPLPSRAPAQHRDMTPVSHLQHQHNRSLDNDALRRRCCSPVPFVTPHIPSPFVSQSPASDGISDINIHRFLPPTPDTPGDEPWVSKNPTSLLRVDTPRREDEEHQNLSRSPSPVCLTSSILVTLSQDAGGASHMAISPPLIQRRPVNSPARALRSESVGPVSQLRILLEQESVATPSPPATFSPHSDSTPTPIIPTPTHPGFLHDIATPRTLRKVRSAEKKDRSAARGAGQVLDPSIPVYEETRHSREIEGLQRAQSADRDWDETEWVEYDEECGSRWRRVLEQKLRGEFGGSGGGGKGDVQGRAGNASCTGIGGEEQDLTESVGENRFLCSLSAHVERRS